MQTAKGILKIRFCACLRWGSFRSSMKTTEEISVGENDTLAAMVACSVDADLLVLLSDIDGLYTKDPHKCEDARLIPLVEQITPALVELAEGKGSSLGTGGMATKLHAAKIVMEHGVDMVIANGARPRKLYNIVEGEAVGTRFVGKEKL